MRCRCDLLEGALLSSAKDRSGSSGGFDKTSTRASTRRSTRRSTRAFFRAKGLNQMGLLHSKARAGTPHRTSGIFRVRAACDRGLAQEPHKSLHKTLHKSRFFAKAFNNNDLSSGDPSPVYTPRYPPQSDLGQAHGPVGADRHQPALIDRVLAPGQIVLA